MTTQQIPEPCEFCPDGHRDPRKRHWGVYVGPERDDDGRPTTLHVMISGGSHIAQSDADWLWKLIRDEKGISNYPVGKP
jgi:hypothetical protein